MHLGKIEHDDFFNYIREYEQENTHSFDINDETLYNNYLDNFIHEDEDDSFVYYDDDDDVLSQYESDIDDE